MIVIHALVALNAEIPSVVLFVMISMNVPPEHINVLAMRIVKIRAVPIFVNAKRVIEVIYTLSHDFNYMIETILVLFIVNQKEMERVVGDVKISMNVIDKMFVKPVQNVKIQEEVTNALTSMSVQMEPINVIKMLLVEMPMMGTLVNVMMVLLVSHTT